MALTVREFLRARLEAPLYETARTLTLDQVKERISRIFHTPTFASLRKNRLFIGTFRYGDTKGWDIASDLIRRAKLYKHSGNKEHLVDIANLCEIEFVYENHPKAHFEAADDAEHVRQMDVVLPESR